MNKFKLKSRGNTLIYLAGFVTLCWIFAKPILLLLFQDFGGLSDTQDVLFFIVIILLCALGITMRIISIFVKSNPEDERLYIESAKNRPDSKIIKIGNIFLILSALWFASGTVIFWDGGNDSFMTTFFIILSGLVILGSSFWVLYIFRYIKMKFNKQENGSL